MAFLKYTKFSLGITILLIFFFSNLSAMTYVDLIKRLTDQEALSVLPSTDEKAFQWSSYDRASYYNMSTGKYANWDANVDKNGIIRMEGNNAVLAEMQGPGCITRIWTAAPDSGHVKIYLDGSLTPVIDLPFTGYFTGSYAPFNYKSLVYKTAAQGYNNYIPISYQTSCKIVAEPGWGGYYHFDYIQFPAGTVVPAFTGALTLAEQTALGNVNNYLLNSLGTDPAGTRNGQQQISNTYDITANNEVTAFQTSAQGAITCIKVKVNDITDKEDESKALRELALSMYWDGLSSPGVWAPLGDFFGTAIGVNHYKSLPLGVTDDGYFYSYWYMPYNSGAVIKIKNDGAVSRNVSVTVVSAPLTKPISQLGRFHAKWNRPYLAAESERWPDHIFLKTTGRGRYVGVMLHNFRPSGLKDPNSKPGSPWWGEGDEKFFVDGEKSPSTYGTGTEDLFGYAWGDGSYFNNVFHSQTLNQGNNGIGNISVNRFQITDNVPFQTSFEGALEKYYDNDYARYGMIPYWYLDQSGTDPYGEISVANRTNYYSLLLTGPGQNWHSYFCANQELPVVGDFDGDCKDDVATFTRSTTADIFVALSNGSAFIGRGVKWNDSFCANDEIPLAGDFNGDGKDDIASFTRGTTGEVYVALSTGSSFGTGIKWNESFCTNNETPLVGDFNGDGKDDIASFTRGTTGEVYVALSTGSSFDAGVKWNDLFCTNDEIPLVGDFNGDGKDDIASFTRGTTGDVYVALSTGSSFDAGVKWNDLFCANDGIPLAGDFNGDGKEDIVSFTRGTTGDVNIALSTGSYFGAGTKWNESFCVNEELPDVGDFNNDGKDDLVTFTRGTNHHVYVGLSVPINPERPCQPAAITKEVIGEDLYIYPNPANNYLKISCSKTINGTPVTVSVMDLSGRPLTIKTMLDSEETIDVSEFSSGLYLVKLETSSFRITQKLIIIH